MQTGRSNAQGPSRNVNGGEIRDPAKYGHALFEKLGAEVTITGGERERIEVECPFNGEMLGSVPGCTATDVEEAFRRARQARKEWSRVSYSERAGVFIRFHDLVLDRRDEILDFDQLETGKARLHAFEELLDTAIVARYYANTAERHLRPRRRQGVMPLLTSVRQYRHPKGVIGFIVPWNYPMTLSVSDAIPALMAGNAAVIKPDRKTPFTALWLARLLRECGLPEGLVQVVTGSGPDVGGEVVDRADFVMFTGSTESGREVARKAAHRLVDASMELGGKNPMIVLDDINTGRAVKGALRACFSNTGQLCTSVERMYVHTAVYERFVSEFVAATRELVLGSSLDYGSDIGSLASRSQLERVREQVREAVDEGARVLTGGRHRPDIGPYFYEPTVLAGVREGMTLHREETFGPIVAVYEFHSEEEAVELANDTRYGLNASIWTGDPRRGQRLGVRLEAGAVNVNEGYAAAWASTDAPIGGFKDSGVGLRHGREGIQKYTESQTIATQRGLPLATPVLGLDGETYAKIMATSLKLLRWVPGVR